jgi:hypothetical protein
MNDIDMTEYEWTQSINGFYGVFNGNEKVISNLSQATGGNGNRGLFSTLRGTVYDLVLENVNFQGNPGTNGQGIGGIAAVAGAGAVIENCHVTGNIVTYGDTWGNTGGIVGTISGAAVSISNCTFNGTIIATNEQGRRLGGIVGYVNASGAIIENCHSAGSIERDGVGSYINFGKIVGDFTTLSGVESSAKLDNNTTTMSINVTHIYGATPTGHHGIELDIDALSLAVEEAEPLKLARTDYTPASYDIFAAALADAEYILVYGRSQEVIDDATFALLDAIDGLEEALPELISVNASAYVTKLNGNQNDLTITVTERYSDGAVNPISVTIKINSNAAGTYAVGDYNVYVDTKGNDQIRACNIVE